MSLNCVCQKCGETKDCDKNAYCNECTAKKDSLVRKFIDGILPDEEPKKDLSDEQPTSLETLRQMMLITDESVSEWKKETLEFLEKVYRKFSTHSMSNHALTLIGQKQMLRAMIDFIRET